METHDDGRSSPARLRPAPPDDAEAIARLHLASRPEACRGLLPAALLASLDLGEWTERRRGHLESPLSEATRNRMLEDEGGAIDWASTGGARDEDLDDSRHELFAPCLDPMRVAQGHGRRLMEQCLTDAANPLPSRRDEPEWRETLVPGGARGLEGRRRTARASGAGDGTAVR